MIFENKICFDGTHLEGLYRDKNIALARGSDDKQGILYTHTDVQILLKKLAEVQSLLNLVAIAKLQHLNLQTF